MFTRGMYTFFGLFCISLLGLNPVSANTGETCPHQAFHVKEVEVSASANSGSEARTIATAEGLNQAWQQLKSRLLVDELGNENKGGNDDKKPAANETVTGEEGIGDLLDHVRIVRETVLPKRYIAAFDYCFDRAKTRQYFAEKKVRHAELVSAPMLILPVWNAGGKPRIWRQPNPWVGAWEDILKARNGLVTLRLPESLATERAIAPQAIIDRDRKAIARAARLENAEKVIVTVITPEIADDIMTVTVSASLFTRQGLIESEFYTSDELSFPVNSTGETTAWLATEIENGIERVWRTVNAIVVDEKDEIMVSIPADSIAEWRAHLRALRGLPTIDRVRVMQLSREGGVVQLNLSASMQSLLYALEATGLAIERKVGENGVVALMLVTRNG